MVVAREHYVDLIARAFDGAVVVDGQRVIAHKSGMHVVRSAIVEQAAIPVPQRSLDPETDWSDV